MGSTNKTTGLGLNQWEPEDAPIRTDFNRDNELLDNGYLALSSRLDGLRNDIKGAQYHQYRMDLVARRDGKNVPSVSTLFSDSLTNTNELNWPLCTTYYDSTNRCLCNYDRTYMTATYTNASTYVGYKDGVTRNSLSQSFLLNEPFRLYRLSEYVINETNTGSFTKTLYSTNTNGMPLSQILHVETVTNMSTSVVPTGWRTVSLAEPFVLPSTRFAVVNTWGGATNHAASWGVTNNQGYLTSVYAKISNSWGEITTKPLAFHLIGSSINNPPVAVTKEKTLLHPCRHATVFFTVNAAGQNRVTPSIALYNPGDTPVFTEMTPQPEQNIALDATRFEYCYSHSQTTPCTRVALKFQMDGLNISAYLYEYGCFLFD